MTGRSPDGAPSPPLPVACAMRGGATHGPRLSEMHSRSLGPPVGCRSFLSRSVFLDAQVLRHGLISRWSSLCAIRDILISFVALLDSLARMGDCDMMHVATSPFAGAKRRSEPCNPTEEERGDCHEAKGAPAPARSKSACPGRDISEAFSLPRSHLAALAASS